MSDSVQSPHRRNEVLCKKCNAVLRLRTKSSIELAARFVCTNASAVSKAGLISRLEVAWRHIRSAYSIGNAIGMAENLK